MSRVSQFRKCSAGYLFPLLLALAVTACRAPGGNADRITPLPEPIRQHAEPPVAVIPAGPPRPATNDAQMPAATVRSSAAVFNGWVPLELWASTNGWSKPRLLDSTTTLSYSLHSTNHSSRFTIGSREARVDDADCWLGFPPKLINGRPHIHALDLEKTLRPLLARPGEFQITNRVVVLDPGHGGDDPGSCSVTAPRFEKEFTLDWARRLRPLLEAQGWQVFVTRTNDVAVSLADRVKLAEDVRADLFVSLHFNSATPGGKQAGLETYCLTPMGMTSNVTRNYPDDPTEFFPNNAFDEQNVQLAARLHRSVLVETNRTDRGVRRARFLGVLRGHNRPAVLIEGGYLSNPEEAELIGTPAYRQKLARAVAHALNGLLHPGVTARAP